MKDVATHHFCHAEEYHAHSSVQKDAAIHLLKYIKLAGYEKILDIGCGDGKITAIIASHIPTGSIIGLDISKEMIDFARKTFPKYHHSNLEFLLHDAQKLNYCEEFDIIFSSFALQWISDPNSFFKSVHKSLKPSGYIAATVPLGISSALEESISTIIARSEWSSYFYMFSPNWHFISDSKYKQLLIEHQFNPIRFATIPQTVLFSTRDSFEKYIIPWFSYLHRLPQYLKQNFLNQIVDKYLEINPAFQNGKVSFKFSRLDVVANKIIL